MHVLENLLKILPLSFWAEFGRWRMGKCGGKMLD